MSPVATRRTTATGALIGALFLGVLGIVLAFAAVGGAAVPRLTTVSRPAGQTGAAGGLYAPTCATAHACFVLAWTDGGANTVLDRFDGRRLTAVGPPLQARGDDVYTMSCPMTRFCMAIGLTRPAGRAVPSAEVWNGQRWRIVPVPSGPQMGISGTASSAAAEASDVELRSVSCASARMCVAVGTSYYGGTAQNDVAVIRRWNGSRWVIDRPAIVHGDLGSVSCGSARFCVIAGAAKNDFTAPEIYRGSGWTPVHLPRIANGGTQGLAAVSCPTATRCVGVGSAAVTVRFDGRLTPTRTALVAGYDAGQWRTQRLPLAPGIETRDSPVADGLGVLSCAPKVTIACTARGGSASPTAAPGTVNSPTGGHDLARLDSTGWTQSKTVLLHNLACASTTLCFAPAAAGGHLNVFTTNPKARRHQPLLQERNSWSAARRSTRGAD
jgi:hypothetical protein